MMMYEVIIIGGGPSGLQAALTLSRALRKTLLIDAKRPRNMNEKHFHNLIGHDGDNIFNFRNNIERQLLSDYKSTFEFREGIVSNIQGTVGKFQISTSTGETFGSKRILLAMGVHDDLANPPFPQYASQLYKSIYQCPYCHGYEIRGKKIAVILPNPLPAPQFLDYAFVAGQWSKDTIIFTNGPLLGENEVARIKHAGFSVEAGVITDLAVDPATQKLTGIVLQDGRKIEREYIFQKVNTKQSELVTNLGLKVENGFVVVKQPTMETSVPGIYATGDLITPLHAIAVAIGNGLTAGAFVNHDLSISAGNLEEASHV